MGLRGLLPPRVMSMEMQVERLKGDAMQPLIMPSICNTVT